MRRTQIATLLFALFLAAAASGQTIAIDVVGKRVHMPVSINGGEPATFILDTGAVKSPIDRTYADAIGLNVKGKARAYGAGGGVEVGLADRAKLAFAGESATIERIPLTPLANISLRIGEPVHGVLGYDVISKYVTEIDYENERVTFHPRSFQPPREAVRVPMRFDGHLPLVDARITLPDGRQVNARLLVDTGAGAPLVLTRAFTAKHKIDVSPGIEASIGMGVGGATRERIGRLPKLQLGGFTFENPIVNLSRDTLGVLSKSDFDGLIGGELLHRFTVYVDYGRKNFALVPNAAFQKPFEFDMSGAFFTTGDGTFKSIVVLNVLDNSPAAAAGLKIGDELKAIDGKPATPADLDEIRALFKKDNQKHELTIGRGGQESVVTLVTKRVL